MFRLKTFFILELVANGFFFTTLLKRFFLFLPMKRLFLILGLLVVMALVACAPAAQPAGEPVPTAADAVPANEPSAGVELNIAQDDTDEVEVVLNDEVELADDASFTVDTDASTMTWQAEKIVGNSHQGEISLSSGSLERQDGAFVSGNFVIDMNSIDYSSQGLVGHLKSDDFFSVETYPEAGFALTSMESLGNGMYAVTGDLTIKGTTNEITFEATELTQDETLVMESSFSIDRTRWGINYDSGSIFSGLGDSAIRDEIAFELNLVLV